MGSQSRMKMTGLTGEQRVSFAVTSKKALEDEHRRVEAEQFALLLALMAKKRKERAQKAVD